MNFVEEYTRQSMFRLSLAVFAYRYCLCLGAGVLVTAAASVAWSADPATWEVGLARRKITPEEPIHLAGYASREKPFDAVASELSLKAMAIKDHQGQRAVLVTSDLIGFRAEVAEPICQEITAKTGLARSQILLNSSHTHTGPQLMLEEGRRSSNMTDEDVRKTIGYTRKLMDDVVAVVEEALDKMQPARLSYGLGVARFVMNRREATEQGVRLGFNPSGYVDRSVPVLRIDSADGKLQAVLFGAACHNTTLGPRDYFVCGDYAGYAQEMIEFEHDGAQAMFMLGCAGSANPWPRGTLENARAHGAELSEEVSRVLGDDLSPVRGSLRIVFDEAELPLAEPPSRAEIDRRLSSRSGSWEPWVAEQMLKRLESGQELPRKYRCPLTVWQFGEDLTLVGLSGEVVGEYVPLLEERLGRRNLWIAAYCNDVYGYLPTAQQLGEGGYETRGLIYGSVGFFSPEAQHALVGKVEAMAEQAGPN